MRMEQPATIPFSGEAGEQGMVLEGLHVPAPDALDGASAGAVIAPPHPLYGGNMLHPVCTELALRLQTAKIASLRFNWRGAGASAGSPSGEPADAAADYAAALDFMEATVDGPIQACGYSWGAATAVAASRGRPRVRKLVLVAPPAAMLDGEAFADFKGDVFVAVGDHDDLADPAALRKLVEGRARVHFEELKGTEHFFATGTVALGRSFEDWLTG